MFVHAVSYYGTHLLLRLPGNNWNSWGGVYWRHFVHWRVREVLWRNSGTDAPGFECCLGILARWYFGIGIFVSSFSTSFLWPTLRQVFCGHEYTVTNLSFGKSVDQNNGRVLEKLNWAKVCHHRYARFTYQWNTVRSNLDAEVKRRLYSSFHNWGWEGYKSFHEGLEPWHPECDQIQWWHILHETTSGYERQI